MGWASEAKLVSSRALPGVQQCLPDSLIHFAWTRMLQVARSQMARWCWSAIFGDLNSLAVVDKWETSGPWNQSKRTRQKLTWGPLGDKEVGIAEIYHRNGSPQAWKVPWAPTKTRDCLFVANGMSRCPSPKKSAGFFCFPNRHRPHAFTLTRCWVGCNRLFGCVSWFKPQLSAEFKGQVFPNPPTQPPIAYVPSDTSRFAAFSSADTIKLKFHGLFPTQVAEKRTCFLTHHLGVTVTVCVM